MVFHQRKIIANLPKIGYCIELEFLNFPIRPLTIRLQSTRPTMMNLQADEASTTRSCQQSGRCWGKEAKYGDQFSAASKAKRPPTLRPPTMRPTITRPVKPLTNSIYHDDESRTRLRGRE